MAKSKLRSQVDAGRKEAQKPSVKAAHDKARRDDSGVTVIKSAKK